MFLPIPFLAHFPLREDNRVWCRHDNGVTIGVETRITAAATMIEDNRAVIAIDVEAGAVHRPINKTIKGAECDDNRLMILLATLPGIEMTAIQDETIEDASLIETTIEEVAAEEILIIEEAEEGEEEEVVVGEETLTVVGIEDGRITINAIEIHEEDAKARTHHKKLI